MIDLLNNLYNFSLFFLVACVLAGFVIVGYLFCIFKFYLGFRDITKELDNIDFNDIIKKENN
ncbi:hypothetical protein [Clostridium saccharoperbutylacetonicum]|uniref:hypothetical protein n=1 Tax=Clostridium saccharoperbutylacetonicum TaxID=36745 RepID=UPI000983E22E|nr:hypothetical protein [Clostridium saccharoperbutylacetonicum]AQR96129.1 hypothetical protein CLSAP_34480 [Clostridium saccharoperbutylacetonicum]NSB31999.1 putative membrane protein YhdT [Clostridium saccharoperbutylacetonicum]